jgi:hypothetical protein
MVFILTSCSSKKTLVKFDYVESGLSGNFLPGNTAYDPTPEEQKYFESVIEDFLTIYPDIDLKEDVFQYSFTKNALGEIEVWMMAYANFGGRPLKKEHIARVTHCRTNYHALINITREKAYFYRDYDRKDSLGSFDIKGYFYIKGKTKEVVNSFEYIDNPAIWRDYNFDDWDSIK